MSACVFFDLETTDLNPCGQIINYAFIEINPFSFEIQSEFCGEIKLSRSQLPMPRAILANRVDVLELQNGNGDCEVVAMKKIREYLENLIHQKNSIRLIGYNSSKFDIHYLRTSMIRNGISPYFGKNITYCDILHLSQNLASTNYYFQKKMELDIKDEVRLSLENCCKNHGLLEGSQLHESKADVLLTIELAKEYLKTYQLDFRTYQCYQAKAFEENKTVVKKVFPKWQARYHTSEGSDDINGKSSAPMVCLENSGNYSLWINLDVYQNLSENPTEDELKSCISWYNSQGSTFFVDEFPYSKESYPELYRLADNVLDGRFDFINLNNFWPRKNCDLEQFIYMIDFDENRAISEMIHFGDFTRAKRLKSKFAAEIHLRFLMNNISMSSTIENFFENYCKYRYGGKMKLNKYDTTEEYNPESYHPHINDMLKDLNIILEESNGEDKKLLESLKIFYLNSPIYKIMASEIIDESA